MLASFQDKRTAWMPTLCSPTARRIAELSYVGDDRFMDALHVMLECYTDDIQVGQRGLARVREMVVRQLVNRARFERDLAEHPEIRDEDVCDPIVILGMPPSVPARRCLHTTINRLGRVDILVNNAATSDAHGPLSAIDDAVFDATFGLNVWAPLLWTRLGLTRPYRCGGTGVSGIS